MNDPYAPVIVQVAGAVKQLRFYPGPTSCGTIEDGCAFEFGRDGSWVVALDELRRLVSLAEQARALLQSPEEHQ